MAGEDRKPARFVPWALLSPGGLWLSLFFLVPVLALVKIALSTPVRFQEPEFNWDFGNFGTALSDYGGQFGRSFLYAGLATLFAFVIGYPLAYCIAAYGGKWKDLLIGLVVIPFFTSFLIRTIAWTSILGNQSFVTKGVRSVMGDDFNFTGTWYGVVGGLTYNFLPFMTLPIYTTLERLDTRYLEAGADLYASPATTFWKVTLPLSLPGIVSGTLLTFIPASGDYINASSSFLGSAQTQMVGNAIEANFLGLLNYPEAAALSVILMGLILVIVGIYVRRTGTEDLL